MTAGSTRSRPRVILSGAMSIDGKIATRAGDSGISSDHDLLRVHKLRSDVDAVVVGRGTVYADDPLLTVRRVGGRNPTRVILGSKGTIPTGSNILRTAGEIPTIMACAAGITRQERSILNEYHVEIIEAGEGIIDLKELLFILYEKGIQSILLEGGGRTNWEFIRQDLVDTILIAIAPFVLGGSSATSLVGGAGFERISDSVRFRLEGVTRMQTELLLEYNRYTR